MPLVMLALWSTVASEAPVGRYGQPEFVAYFLVTFIVRQLTGSWVFYEMNFAVRNGTGEKCPRPRVRAKQVEAVRAEQDKGE